MKYYIIVHINLFWGIMLLQAHPTDTCDDFHIQIMDCYHDSLDLAGDRLVFTNFARQADVQNCPTERSLAFTILGNRYKANGIYQEAQIYYDSALHIRKELKDYLGIASIFNNLIGLERSEGFPRRGLQCADSAIWYIHFLNRSEKGVQSLKNKIIYNSAHCHRSLGDIIKARKGYESVKDSFFTTDPLSNYAIGNLEYDNKNYIEAINYYEEAVKTRRNDDLLVQLYIGIGYAYLKLYLEDKEKNQHDPNRNNTHYTKAKEFFTKSLEEAKKINNKLYSLDAIMGLVQLSDNKDSSSIYYEQLLATHTPTIGNYEEQVKLLDLLAKHCITESNNFQQAYLYKQQQASLVSETLVKKIKNEEILIAQEKIDRIRALLVLLVMGSVIFFIIRKKWENRKLELFYSNTWLKLEYNIREQLANETHDIKTEAAAVRNQLHFAKDHYDTVSDLRGLISTTHNAADNLVDQIRDLIDGLKPISGEWHSGIMRLVKMQETDLTIQKNINLPGNLEKLLDPTSGLILYYSLNVLIDNVLEHANADTLSIQIFLEAKHLKVLLVDDGRGFKYERAKEGVGLKSCRQRIKKLGGEFKVDSEPGKGTSISIKLPCKSNIK